MRILIGMIWQETNTFSPVRTTLEDFGNLGLHYGKEIVEKYANVTELGGFIQAAKSEKPSVEIVPSIRAAAWPAGKVEKSTYHFLRDELFARIEAERDIDGILLALHGSMVAEDIDDTEGDLLCGIRRKVGRGIPVGISLDLHSNITELMIRSIDVLVGYHTYPHVDMYETGYQAAKILFSVVKRDIRAMIGWKKIPMITPAEKQSTFHGPLAKIFAQAESMENNRNVVSASIFPVQPWIDVRELGWSTVVVTDDKPRLAQKLAEDLAVLCGNQREAFHIERVPLEQALNKALTIDGGPIVLSDAADSTNSGAPGDSTVILEALMARKIDGESFLTIVDPEAVERAIAAGVGQEVTLEVGGKRDNIYSKPIETTGRIRKVSDGRFVIKGPMAKNLEVNIGRTAVLDVHGINIVLSEHTGPGHDPSIYRSVGLEPEDAKIVVVKSPEGFRAAYESFAKEILLVDTPGIASSNIRSLPFKTAPRPLYPLDEDAKF